MSGWRGLFAASMLAVVSACAASRVQVESNPAILEEESARLPSPNGLPANVTLLVNAPGLAVARHPPKYDENPLLYGKPRFELTYHARSMFEPAAGKMVKRWLNPGTALNVPAITIDLRHQPVIFWIETDVNSFRPAATASVAITARDAQGVVITGEFSSDVVRGKWSRAGWMSTLPAEEESLYAHVIYRAMLLALDTAMGETAARLRSRLGGER